MVLREVLQLDEPACPAAGAVGSIELKHPSGSAVFTGGVLHSLVFLYGGFGKLLSESEGLPDIILIFGCGFKQGFDSFFVERVCFDALCLQPSR